MKTTSDRWDTLIHNARVATMDPAFGTPYGEVPGVMVGLSGRQIVFVGGVDDLPASIEDCATHQVDLRGHWLFPGLIDCHTHLVFGGQRAQEFEQRLNGASYEDIARAGGGIVSTVRQTREQSETELLASALPRAKALAAEGVCTLEIKSGYGLDFDTERKMLRVARQLGTELGIDVRTTYLGLHALPPEYRQDRATYVDLAIDQWLPALHAEGLVDAVDAFMEGIAFTAAETDRLFARAQALGLPVKLHADQLSNGGGAALCARYRGLSADHVEYTDAFAVGAMAAAGTVAVLLPGSFYCLRETRLPPIDSFRRHGVPMAVSTDLNPGTSPLRSLLLAANQACTLFRLTPEEAIAGITRHAAQALGLADRKGRIAVGLDADLVAYPISQPAELCYWLGGHQPSATWRAGIRT
ncbi:MAG: imidazolonepropionase [Ahniella sp.]|nr:imidazolonepropionase [Ahniella sp.]